MKIKTIVTEIECSANELRQSNAISDGLSNLLRGCFNNMTSDYDESENEEQEESEEP
jgi:hypothetical protein